jgi:hypothetical protein
VPGATRIKCVRAVRERARLRAMNVAASFARQGVKLGDRRNGN